MLVGIGDRPLRLTGLPASSLGSGKPTGEYGLLSARIRLSVGVGPLFSTKSATEQHAPATSQQAYPAEANGPITARTAANPRVAGAKPSIQRVRPVCAYALRTRKPPKMFAVLRLNPV